MKHPKTKSTIPLGSARGRSAAFLLLATATLSAHPDRVSDHANIPAPIDQTPSGRVQTDESAGELVKATGAWWEWDRATGDWGGVRNSLLGRGIDLFGGYTGEAWGNLSGGEKRGAVATHLFDFGIEIDLEKAIGWEGATIHNAWFAPLGRDLSADKVGNFLTVSNAAALPSLYLFELWFQQNLWDDRLSLRFGQLAADEEFAGTEYGGLFLNSTFGWPPFVSGNLPNVGPAFPKGTLGVRLAVTPIEWFTLQSAVYQGDPFSDEENNHGTRWKLGGDIGYTLMNEAQFRWNSGEEADGLPGQAKLGVWVHSGETSAAWEGSGEVHSGNHGFYLVLEQELYRERTLEGEAVDQGIGWFGRAGKNPEDRNFIGTYFETGLTWKGAIPGRDEDTFGLGFAYAGLTRGARRSLDDSGAKSANSEMVLELTYQCQLTPWMTVQPDLQYVIHPGATRDLGNAWVVGLRTAISF